jgi:hypothetical protein
LQWPKVLNAPLEQVDPELFDIIEHEKNRQFKVSSSSSSSCAGGLRLTHTPPNSSGYPKPCSVVTIIYRLRCSS